MSDDEAKAIAAIWAVKARLSKDPLLVDPPMRVEMATDPATAIYWHNQHFGVWIAPNPLPAQPMDTLLQLEWRFQRNGNTDMMLRIKRADLINAMTMAKELIALAGRHADQMCYALGDADFRYIIRLSTRGGIDNAERGVLITLQRDAMPSAPLPKRKIDLRTSYEIPISASDFARLCAKLEV